MRKPKAETIAGYTLPEPRLTLTAVGLGALWVGVPLLVVTGLMDLGMQVIFGVCTGVWCLVK